MNDQADREEQETHRAAQGALARDILARDRRHVWHPFTQHGTEAEPILIAAARGASLYDAEGREILDLIASGLSTSEIAKKLTIKTGKNAGKSTSVASLYRALAERKLTR